MRTEPSFSEESDDQFPEGTSGTAFVEGEAPSLADYRQHYGLSLEPFADDAHFPFYTGAQRRQVLDQILHLCQFSQNVLLVLGDYGVGKTRMAQALIDALSDEDDICFLEGQINSTFDALMADLLAQLELESPDNFTEFALASADHPGLLVVIIDNAHHLPDDVICELLGLINTADGSRLHLVFFSEPHLLPRFEKIDAPEIVLSDFYLDRFTLVEAVDYLNFRMEMADYLGPELFAESRVEPWWRESQGSLLILHEYAHEYLLSSIVQLRPAKSVTKGFPVAHVASASLLLAGLIMGGLYWGGNKKDLSQVTTQVAIPRVDASSAEAQVSAPATSVATNIQAASSSAASELPMSSAASLSAAPVSLESQVVKQSVVPLAQANSLHSVQQSSVRSVKSISSVARSSAGNISSGAGSTKELKPEVLPAEKPKATTAGFSEQESTILSWDASEFTLQLVGVSTEKAVKEFIAEQPNRKDLLVFKTQRMGKDWFVVVTGRYTSSAKARQAIQQLPESQKKASPWPREIKIIQKEIRQK